MLIRDYGKYFGIVYATKEAFKLINFIKSRGFKLDDKVKKKNREEIYTLGKSEIRIHKNKEYYIIECFSDEYEKVSNQIIVAERLNIIYSEISSNVSLEYGGDYIHSDLFGNSIADLSETIYDLLKTEVDKHIYNYNLLRHYSSDMIVSDILFKWIDNQNYFAGNKQMLSSLISKTVLNTLNTMHKQAKKVRIKSIDDKLSEDLKIEDTLSSESKEKNILNKVTIESLGEIQKLIVERLLSGYKIMEICEECNLNSFEFNEIVSGIKLN